MTPQISKEAMEKAKEVWQTVFAAYRKAPLGTTIDKVGTPLIALEFTNYQKRVEELEKALIDVLNKDLGGKSVKSQSMVAAELCLAK
jgi:hypothetical protein